MSELIRAGGSLPANLHGRSRRDARDIIRKVQLAGLELQGDAALTGLSMELTVGLYDEALALTATRPDLQSLLFQHVTGFATTAQSKIRTRNSPFGSL